MSAHYTKSEVKELSQPTVEMRDSEQLGTQKMARLSQAQALIHKYAMHDGSSPVDELMAERRAEAARE